MDINALLTHHEEQLAEIIQQLEKNEFIDLQPFASNWHAFLEKLGEQDLSNSQKMSFDRISASFKKIEELLAEKMSELVMATTMTQG